MFKAGEKLQSLLTVLITWAVLLALFFSYEAYVVKGQEGFLRDRGFRALTSISTVLDAKFDQAQVSAVSSVKLIQDVNRKKEGDQDYNGGPKEALNDYLRLYLPDVLAPRGVVYSSPEKCWVDSKNQVPVKTSLEGGGLILRISCYSVVDPKAPDHPDLTSEMPIYQLDLSDQIRHAFEPFRGSFDDILVANSKGHIVFQQVGTGPIVSDLKALAPNKDTISVFSIKKDSAGSDSATANVASAPNSSTPGSGSTTSGPNMGESEARWIQSMNQASTFSTVRLGEESYGLFTQPAQIPKGNYPGVGVDEFVVCGLRRASSFEEEAHAIPYTLLIWLALLAVALFSLSWPFFKLHYMSNTERFSPRDGWYLMFAIFLASTSTMMMFLNWTYESEAESITDDNTVQLASKIKDHVHVELYAAALQLQRLTANSKMQEIFKEGERSKFIPKYLNGKNPSQIPVDPCYPYFEIAFWAKHDGTQLSKIDVRPVTTPSTSVSLSPYFTASTSELDPGGAAKPMKVDEKERLQAALPAACKDSLLPTIDLPERIHLQPLFSPNTGEFLAILAFPVADVRAKASPPPKIAVQALATQPLSLVDPLLPPGYSFAVIDQQCSVLFDSASSRDLRENFCQESITGNELKPWLFSGVDKAIDITYSGRRGRAFLTSMALPGLTLPSLPADQAFLIVFEDPDLKPTLNLAIILVCSVLMGFLLLFIFIAVVLHLLFRGALHLIYPPEFIWPKPGNAISYIHILLANGLMFLLFWIAYQRLYEGPLLTLTLAVAIFTVLFTLLKLWPKTKALLWIGWMVMLASDMCIVISVGLLVMAPVDQAPLEPIQEWIVVLGSLAFFGLIAILLSGETSLVSRFTRFGSRGIPWIEKKARERFGLAYALAALSLINAAGLVPCAGFFKYSYDAVSELSLKRDQTSFRREG